MVHRLRPDHVCHLGHALRPWKAPAKYSSRMEINAQKVQLRLQRAVQSGTDDVQNIDPGLLPHPVKEQPHLQVGDDQHAFHRQRWRFRLDHA